MRKLHARTGIDGSSDAVEECHRHKRHLPRCAAWRQHDRDRSAANRHAPHCHHCVVRAPVKMSKASRTSGSVGAAERH